MVSILLINESVWRELVEAGSADTQDMYAGLVVNLSLFCGIRADVFKSGTSSLCPACSWFKKLPETKNRFIAFNSH